MAARAAPPLPPCPQSVAYNRILGCETDIMTRDSLHRLLRADIEATAVPVF